MSTRNQGDKSNDEHVQNIFPQDVAIFKTSIRDNLLKDTSFALIIKIHQ